MRSGQRAGRAHDLVTGDAAGRILCTVRFVMDHEAGRGEPRHINVVRRAAAAASNGDDWPPGPVGCDVGTGALLYDAGALGKALAAVGRSHSTRRRNPNLGHAAKSSRSVS